VRRDRAHEVDAFAARPLERDLEVCRHRGLNVTGGRKPSLGFRHASSMSDVVAVVGS
jgi:hypothetical protein